VAEPLLLGVDLGASGVKAVLLSPARGIVASERVDTALSSPHPGWAEADPEAWWRALVAMVPRLLQAADASAASVRAVAVAGMVPAILALDEAGTPLRAAMLQNDARATVELEEMREVLADVDLLALTGSVLSQQSVAPSALWLSRHEPEVWSRTASIVGSYDWLARRLGADLHVEANWAIESGLYDLSLVPLDAVRAATGLAWPRLAPVRRPGDVVGEVSAAVATETGLAAGTPIVVGGADHVLSAYGAGLVGRGDCLVKLGSAGDILCVSDEPLVDERLYLDAHPVPGKWLPNGCMATSGSMLRWEQALFGGAPLEDLDAAARGSAPGTLLALPFFLGEKTPLHDPDLRGAILGLHLGTTRADVHRALLEAIAFGFRSHVDVFLQRGLKVERCVVTNGGSRSRLWREILADVLGHPLTSIVAHPGASFGAAVLAGLGVGAIEDWAYPVGALGDGETIEPDASRRSLYDERYVEFRELTVATAPFSHRLSRSHP
jgi:xylulokinase